MLDTISSIIVQLECMSSDLEHEFGDDILTKKIGKGFKNGSYKYSLRDRYGAICDRLLNTSLSIAQTLGVEEKELDVKKKELSKKISEIFNGQRTAEVRLNFPRLYWQG